jgi:DNA-binding transcriptional ArsR family regulator/rhodanese-related sulfurtransferase
MAKLQHLQTARIGHALSSPVRLRTLNLLAQRDWSVGELAAELGESVALTSAHLRTLREACLVMYERLGRRVLYRIGGPEAILLLAALNRAASMLLPELREVVREALSDPTRLEQIDPTALADDVATGRVRLIDLRPREEFAAGRLPCARSLPFRELHTMDLDDLPHDGSVYAYCRGPWCVMAKMGVTLLNERGVPTRLLPLGVVEWQAQGMVLEREVDSASTAEQIGTK